MTPVQYTATIKRGEITVTRIDPVNQERVVIRRSTLDGYAADKQADLWLGWKGWKRTSSWAVSKESGLATASVVSIH